MSQLDKTFCEGFVTYLANAMTIGFEIPKRGQHHQKNLPREQLVFISIRLLLR